MTNVRSEMHRAHRELVEHLREVGISASEWDAYRLEFRGDTDVPLVARSRAIEAEFDAM